MAESAGGAMLTTSRDEESVVLMVATSDNNYTEVNLTPDAARQLAAGLLIQARELDKEFSAALAEEIAALKDVTVEDIAGATPHAGWVPGAYETREEDKDATEGG